MKIYGTWHAFLVKQLAEEDVKGFLAAVIEEYQIHGDLTTIQLALQYVVEAQGGISEFAKKTDLDSQVLSEVLASTEAPQIDKLRAVLSTLGCCLPIGSLETANTPITVATEGSAVAPEAVAPKHNLD